MNTIHCFKRTYPKPPKGWRGIGYYYEKELLTTLQASEDASAEDCEQLARAVPGCNCFSVSDADHPNGWLYGTC